MFDSVCGHVHLQTGCIYVSFVTIGALVGLVFVVLTPVGLWGKQNKVAQRDQTEDFSFDQLISWNVTTHSTHCTIIVFPQYDFYNSTNHLIVY